MSPLVGVLALQGGVREHASVLTGLGATVRAVRDPADLSGLDAVVLPGGESSVMDRLGRLYGLAEPLRDLIVGGLPTLGTCAGLVLLAREILDPAPTQRSLGVLDITVRRNAFGSQVHSAEHEVNTVLGLVRAAFIRAPEVVRVGPGVQVVARREQAIIGVRAGAVTGLSFHPELTGDPTFHAALLADCGRPGKLAQLGCPTNGSEPSSVLSGLVGER